MCECATHCRSHWVMASTASVWRALSWRKSMRMRPSPKHCSRRRQSSNRPSATMPPPAPAQQLRVVHGVNSAGRILDAEFDAQQPARGCRVQARVQTHSEAAKPGAWHPARAHDLSPPTEPKCDAEQAFRQRFLNPETVAERHGLGILCRAPQSQSDQ